MQKTKGLILSKKEERKKRKIKRGRKVISVLKYKIKYLSEIASTDWLLFPRLNSLLCEFLAPLNRQNLELPIMASSFHITRRIWLVCHLERILQLDPCSAETEVMVDFLYLRSQRGTKEMCACTFQSYTAFSSVIAVGNYLHTPTNIHMYTHMRLCTYVETEREWTVFPHPQIEAQQGSNSTQNPSRMRKVIFFPNFIYWVTQLGYRWYTTNRSVNALYMKNDVSIMLFCWYFACDG